MLDISVLNRSVSASGVSNFILFDESVKYRSVYD